MQQKESRIYVGSGVSQTPNKFLNRKEFIIMYEEQIIKCLKNLGKQVWSLQQLMANLDRDVRNMRVSGNTVVKTLPFGVKDISSVQLVDAYTRGLNMEQLIALGNQKYTAEQIYNKLRRAGVAD